MACKYIITPDAKVCLNCKKFCCEECYEQPRKWKIQKNDDFPCLCSLQFPVSLRDCSDEFNEAKVIFSKIHITCLNDSKKCPCTIRYDELYNLVEKTDEFHLSKCSYRLWKHKVCQSKVPFINKEAHVRVC